MATQTLQPEAAPTNGIVAAYLSAHAKENELDRSGANPDEFETRMAQFAIAGAERYAMAWGIHSDEHGALVAVLAANRLQNLLDGFTTTNDRKQQILTLGVEELYEIQQIKKAMLNLWQHLEPSRNRRLQPLAQDMGLINEHGVMID